MQTSSEWLFWLFTKEVFTFAWRAYLALQKPKTTLKAICENLYVWETLFLLKIHSTGMKFMQNVAKIRIALCLNVQCLLWKGSVLYVFHWKWWGWGKYQGPNKFDSLRPVGTRIYPKIYPLPPLSSKAWRNRCEEYAPVTSRFAASTTDCFCYSPITLKYT